MNRFTDFRPQVAPDPQDGPEPTLFEIIEGYYIELDDPQKATADYIAAWLALERADRDRKLAAINLALSEINRVDEAARTKQFEELKSILRRFDDLAHRWGDESGFHQCRDRLRKIIEHPV